MTREDLRGLGFTDERVNSWLRSGLLIPRYCGVYLLGHDAEPPYAEEMAAVLACRPGAVVGHRSAVHLWWGEATDPRPSPIELVVVRRKLAPRDGIRVHTTRSLEPDEIAMRHGVPITSPSRTIVDFAGDATDDEVEWAIGRAQRGGAATRGHLLALLQRRPRVHGAARLRRLLAGPTPFTRSQAERRLLRLLAADGLPVPLANEPLFGFEVDVLWPQAGLVVEFDGFEFHGDRAAFERDRARDAKLVACGYVVIRVTWRQLVGDPATVASRIAAAYRTRYSSQSNGG